MMRVNPEGNASVLHFLRVGVLCNSYGTVQVES